MYPFAGKNKRISKTPKYIMGKLEETRNTPRSGSTDALPVVKPNKVPLPGTKRTIEVLRGDFERLPKNLQDFIATNVSIYVHYLNVWIYMLSN